MQRQRYAEATQPGFADAERDGTGLRRNLDTFDVTMLGIAAIICRFLRNDPGAGRSVLYIPDGGAWLDELFQVWNLDGRRAGRLLHI
jgi:hypothetical protein